MCLQPDGGVQFDTVGDAGARRRAQDRRQRRGAGARADAAEGVLQAAGRDRRVDRRRRLLPHRRRRLLRRERPAEDHRSREGRRQARDAARCSRPTTSRTSSSSSRTSRKRSRSATTATACARSSTSTSARSATGPSGAAFAYSGYTDLAAKPEVYELIRDCVEKVNAELAGEPGARRFAGAALPDPAQGARSRRRRADAHAQGAPRLHRREVREC